MKIFNTQVYGLHEAIIRSGYPMKMEIEEIDEEKFKLAKEREPIAVKLAQCKSGTGHDSFLKGIIVTADIDAPTYWWPQWMRYHFQDTISSQSKMHKLKSLTLEQIMERLNIKKGTERNTITREYLAVMRNAFLGEEITFEEYLGSIPMGFEYTAGVVTNYLQLKSMYLQREHHPLTMWNEVFTEWVKSLPMSKEFIIGGYYK